MPGSRRFHEQHVGPRGREELEGAFSGGMDANTIEAFGAPYPFLQFGGERRLFLDEGDFDFHDRTIRLRAVVQADGEPDANTAAVVPRPGFAGAADFGKALAHVGLTVVGRRRQAARESPGRHSVTAISRLPCSSRTVRRRRLREHVSPMFLEGLLDRHEQLVPDDEREGTVLASTGMSRRHFTPAALR